MNRSDIELIFQQQKNKQDLFRIIVNIPFINRVQSTELGLGIVVLLLISADGSTLDHIALSDTELARSAVDMSLKDFHEIRIPIDYEDNILIKVVKTSKFLQTDNWKHMFTSVFSNEEARLHQAGAGIGCSVIYPIVVSDTEKVFG